MSSLSDEPRVAILVDSTLEAVKIQNAPFPTQNRPAAIEKSSILFNDFKGTPNPLHGFVDALHQAYCNHLTLILKPDDFWLVVAGEICDYINDPDNTERLRKHLVLHEKGKKLLSLAVDFDLQSFTSDKWAGAMNQMVEQMKLHCTFPLTFEPTFTTTLPSHRLMGYAVTMSALKQYFEFRFRTMCGIPKVELRGTKDDWEKLLARTAELADHPAFTELRPWFTKLLDLYTSISSSYSNPESPESKELWSNIYKYNNRKGSGGPNVTGWVNNLFIQSMSQTKFHTDDYPTGLYSFDFQFKGADNQFSVLRCMTGFDGPEIDSFARTVEPRIGTVVHLQKV